MITPGGRKALGGLSDLCRPAIYARILFLTRKGKSPTFS